MQQWLKQRQTEYARAAQIRACKKCGATILTGLDADIAALKVEIDPTPITPLGEAVALLQGRSTYQLHTARGARQIHHRNDWNITAPRTRPVYPAHRCGHPLDDHLDTTWTTPPPQPPAPTTPQEDTPPF